MCSNPRVQKVVVSPIALHSWGAPLCLAWEWQQGDPPSAPVKWQVRTGSYNRSAAGLCSCKVWHWRREWSPQTSVLLLPALTVACSLCIPTASEERLEVQSKTPLFLNLSSCPRTLVHLIAVSVHSEILTISLSAPAKHVLSICPWNQPSLRKVIKVVVCWMNHAHLFFSFFFLFSALPSRNHPCSPPPPLHTSHDRASSLQFIMFALVCFPSDSLWDIASTDLWQRNGNSTHFYPGTRQQQWQIGLLFCLTLGGVSRERGFYQPRVTYASKMGFVISLLCCYLKYIFGFLYYCLGMKKVLPKRMEPSGGK